MTDDPKDGVANPIEDRKTNESGEEPEDTRREFLTSLGKWSKAVIGLAVFGTAVLHGDAQAQEEWGHGHRGGGGWRNHGGGGWRNHGGGGWRNHGGGGFWRNHGPRWRNFPGWNDYPVWNDTPAWEDFPGWNDYQPDDE